MSEQDTLRLIQLHASRLGHRLFRNNIGTGWVGKFLRRYDNGSVLIGNARPLHAGLMEGSADLIGLTNSGRFLSIEVKSEDGRLRDEQRKWLAMVQRHGGLAGEVRSIDDLEAILNE